MHNRALMTSGGLTKKDLTYNNKNCIVSKRASNRAKKDMRLQKAGFITTKGEFKLFNKQTGGAINGYLQYVQMAIKGTCRDESSYKIISAAPAPAAVAAAAALTIEQQCIYKIKKKFKGKPHPEIKGVLYSPHERWKDEQQYNSLLAVAVWSGRNKIVETILDLMLKVNPQKQKDKEYIEAWNEGLKVANKNLTDIIELLNNEKYKPDIGNSFEQIASNEAMARGNIPPNPLIPNLKYMFSSNNTSIPSKPLENTSHNEIFAKQLWEQEESKLTPDQLAKQKNARRIHERNNEQDKLYGMQLVQQYYLHTGTLKNIGNSCFANSVFQLLYSMDDFRIIIIGADIDESRLDTIPNIVLYCIQQIFKNLKQNIESFDIETIRIDFGTDGIYNAAQLLYGYSKLEIYKQHDQSEFMNYILDMLLDSQVKDAISKLFRITLVNNNTYRNETKKLTPVIENYISCGIKALTEPADINSTISYYQRDEITENRNEELPNNIIKKNIQIKIDPKQKYLIIRLNRDHYNPGSSITKVFKDVCLNDYITIDSTPFKLKGFIIHMGGGGGGHYVYVHHISSENRILYNDGIYRKYRDAQYNHRQNTVLVLYEKIDHIVPDDGAGAGAAAQINLPAGHSGPTNLTRNEIRQLVYSTIEVKQGNKIYKLKFNRYKIAFPSKPDEEIDELVMSEILK